MKPRALSDQRAKPGVRATAGAADEHASCKTIEQMRLADALCRFVEMAVDV